MKCSLGISNFLEEISILSHSVVFLYFFALITEEGFLISSCYSLELCIQMSLIKDRNGMDLTEAEDIKKRWQESTEELYEKHLHNPDNHDGVITHLEPDILENKSSGPQKASLRTKLVEVMEFQLSYFKS